MELKEDKTRKQEDDKGIGRGRDKEAGIDERRRGGGKRGGRGEMDK